MRLTYSKWGAKVYNPWLHLIKWVVLEQESSFRASWVWTCASGVENEQLEIAIGL